MQVSRNNNKKYGEKKGRNERKEERIFSALVVISRDALGGWFGLLFGVLAAGFYSRFSFRWSSDGAGHGLPRVSDDDGDSNNYD